MKKIFFLFGGRRQRSSLWRKRLPRVRRRPYAVFGNDSRVNASARKFRHQKLFNTSGSENARLRTNILLSFVHIRSMWQRLFLAYKSRRHSFYTSHQALALLSPSSHVKRLVMLVLVVFVFGSLNFGSVQAEIGGDTDWSYLGTDEDLDNFLTDDDGYLLKAVPSELAGGIYVNRDKLITEHEVQPGQSLSLIAEMYGLRMKTIMWANNISNANSLRVGQVIEIPRVNGLLYKVKTGDTVNKIAETYKIEADKVRQENELSGDLIALNQILLLPEAEPIFVPDTSSKIASSPKSGTKLKTTAVEKSVNKPSDKSGAVAKGKLIFPTIGVFTQSFHRGHYATDIANRSPNTPVYAAASGTIIRADGDGAWYGGYGNIIIIQHPNGLQTLYAHLNILYVKVGQEVKAGETIAIMGNTGRSTGPHVHFEVIDNGVKRNPVNYF